jgi:hypothetical protein
MELQIVCKYMSMARKNKTRFKTMDTKFLRRIETKQEGIETEL